MCLRNEAYRVLCFRIPRTQVASLCIIDSHISQARFCLARGERAVVHVMIIVVISIYYICRSHAMNSNYIHKVFTS